MFMGKIEIQCLGSSGRSRCRCLLAARAKAKGGGNASNGMLGYICLMRTSLTIDCAEINIWELACLFISSLILVLSKRPAED